MRPRFDLLVITDGGPRLVERLEGLRTALSARVAILLRDKHATTCALLAQASALRRLTRERDATLLISDRIDVALASQADGVQLPETSFSVSEARALLGPGRIVGASRHDLAGVLEAESMGADYATLSPVYAAPDKGSPLGVASFAVQARATQLPLYALGGVTERHVPELVRAGAFGVAAIREVLACAEPARAMTSLLGALTRARST